MKWGHFVPLPTGRGVLEMGEIKNGHLAPPRGVSTLLVGKYKAFGKKIAS